MTKVFGIVLIVIAIAMFVLGEFFVIRGNKYKVEFTNIDENYTVEVEKNGYLRKPNDPRREGYTFLGWYYNDVKFNFNSKIDKDITLVAKWSESNGSSELENSSSLSTSLWNLIKNIFSR